MGIFCFHALRTIPPPFGSPTMASGSAPIVVITVPSGAAMSRVSFCSWNSARLIMGSADQTVKLWNVQTGAQLFTFNFGSPARSVDFSVGDKLAVITTDPFLELTSAIHVKRIAGDLTEHRNFETLRYSLKDWGICPCHQGPSRMNKQSCNGTPQYEYTTIVSAGEDAVIRLWDSETGKLLMESNKDLGHKKAITSLSKSRDGSNFLIGSLDKSSKLWDTRTLTLIKNFVTERPVNAVAMAPLLEHVVLGGGPDPSAVTTTDHRAGKFEAKFYDKV
ncbi:hypothetical protein V6N13_144508 [Hibiscus sabdariffa]